MHLVPIYFFIVLCLGFMLIYTFKNKQYFIEKKKKVDCEGENCFKK